MKNAQLIKRTTNILYLKDGIVLENLEPIQKLHHSLFFETKVMQIEEIVERWNLKTKKDANQRFWDFMTENNIEDSSDYYVVFAD
jgi:hypothetical protein